MISALAAQDYDEEETRGPYEFQFRVDDPETYNKYEVRTMLVTLIKIAIITILDSRIG